MKIHAIHIVNQSWVFDIIFKFFSTLLNDKMRSRIFFHGDNMESLHEHIEPKYLPEKYGGVRAETNYKDWLYEMRKNETILKEMRQLGYIVEDEDIKRFLEENNFLVDI